MSFRRGRVKRYEKEFQEKGKPHPAEKRGETGAEYCQKQNGGRNAVPSNRRPAYANPVLADAPPARTVNYQALAGEVERIYRPADPVHATHKNIGSLEAIILFWSRACRISDPRKGQPLRKPTALSCSPAKSGPAPFRSGVTFDLKSVSASGLTHAPAGPAMDSH